MKPVNSCKTITLKDFSRGLIAPLIAPPLQESAYQNEAIAEQTKRLAEIGGVIGVEVNMALEVGRSSLGTARLDYLKTARGALKEEQLLIVRLGPFSNDLVETCSACAEFGANAIVTELGIAARAKTSLSNNDYIEHQAHLADQTCLPILLDLPCSEAVQERAFGKLHDLVAKHSTNVVGVVMRCDDQTWTYDESYYALKTINRPIACLTASETALFHNLNTGADGVISKLASIAPHDVVALFHASREGRFFDAQAIHNKLSGLIELIGNQSPNDRELVFQAIARKRGLLVSSDLDRGIRKLDTAAIRKIDEALDAVSLTPID